MCFRLQQMCVQYKEGDGLWKGHWILGIKTLNIKCKPRQLMHWDTFKQDSTVGGDGGCRVGEVRAGTTSPHAW